MRLALLALLLTGCADTMVLRHPIDTVTVTWVDRKCGKSEGCALPMGEQCIVAMPKDSDVSLVGHEIKHCFGFEHE